MKRQATRRKSARERLLNACAVTFPPDRHTRRVRRLLRAHERELAKRGMNAVPVRGRRGGAAYMASLALGRAVYAAILGRARRGGGK